MSKFTDIVTVPDMVAIDYIRKIYADNLLSLRIFSYPVEGFKYELFLTPLKYVKVQVNMGTGEIKEI